MMARFGGHVFAALALASMSGGMADAAPMARAYDFSPPPRRERKLTQEDEAAKKKAEEKRARKAAKRRK